MYIAEMLLKISMKLNLNFTSKKLNDLIHGYWYLRLLPYFKKAQKKVINTNIKENNSGKCIWIFWWQGFESMPELVKCCYKSVEKHANGHEIILVTKDNFKKYTEIDNTILEKFYKGNITLTFLSDVIRFNLLKRHGGLWLDSTVFVTEDIKDVFFEDLFTVGIDDTKLHNSVNGAYSSFIIGGSSNNALFNFMDKFFIEYYSHKNSIEYYFTLDEALNYCYKNNVSGFKNYVDNYSFDSDHTIHYLQGKLNDVYNENEYDKFRNRFFKLTYKSHLNGEENTYYNVLIRNKK